MNVKEMVFRGEEVTKLYSCGECGQCYSPKAYACEEAVAHETAREAAEKCCEPSTCSVCGVEIEKYWTKCAKHREQAKLARAKAVPAAEWSGPVFSDDVSGDWGEGYSSCWQEMLRHHEDEQVWAEQDYYAVFAEEQAAAESQPTALPNEPPPKFEPALPPAYCWPCEVEALRIDPDSLLENAADGMHEDAFDEIVDADELADFIEAWNTKQTCTSYYPDYKRVIVLDEVRFKALLEGGE